MSLARLPIALLFLTAFPPICSADTLYDNGDFDQRTALRSVRGTSLPFDVADDFTLTAVSVIEEIQAKFVFRDFPSTLDMLVYEYTPEGPGDIVEEIRDLDYEVSDLGVFRGLTSATVTILGLSFALAPGDYFLSIRGVASDDNEVSYWGSTGPSPVNLGEGYFRSEDYGYPNWVPVSRLYGIPGVDFSFKLLGYPCSHLACRW